MQNQRSQSIEEMVQDAFAHYSQAETVGPGELVIWGGYFPEQEMSVFLQKWGTTLAAMPWSMIETVSGFQVQKNNPAGAVGTAGDTLERARLFGRAGDLDLRRDGSRFYWRFFGDPSDALPLLAPAFPYHDYWQDYADDVHRFKVVEEIYVQWRPGEGRVSDGWRGDGAEAAETRRLRQRHYLLGGQIVFVRYIDFEGGEA